MTNMQKHFLQLLGIFQHIWQCILTLGYVMESALHATSENLHVSPVHCQGRLDSFYVTVIILVLRAVQQRTHGTVTRMKCGVYIQRWCHRAFSPLVTFTTHILSFIFAASLTRSRKTWFGNQKNTKLHLGSIFFIIKFAWSPAPVRILFEFQRLLNLGNTHQSFMVITRIYLLCCHKSIKVYTRAYSSLTTSTISFVVHF